MSQCDISATHWDFLQFSLHPIMVICVKSLFFSFILLLVLNTRLWKQKVKKKRDKKLLSLESAVNSWRFWDLIVSVIYSNDEGVKRVFFYHLTLLCKMTAFLTQRGFTVKTRSNRSVHLSATILGLKHKKKDDCVRHDHTYSFYTAIGLLLFPCAIY